METHVHREHIEMFEGGVEVGTCACGRTTQYTWDSGKRRQSVTKLGRVDGKILPPLEGEHLMLSPEEDAEYKAAGSPRTPLPSESPIYIGKPPKYQRGGRKWRSRCKACESGYLHDEILWCSSSVCSQHCPPQLRPQFRPRVEAEAATIQGAATDAPAVPPRPRESKRQQYFEDNKPAMLEDYEKLKLSDFLLKWHMSPTTWKNLKDLWEVKGKQTKGKSPSDTKVTKVDKGNRLVPLGTFTVVAAGELPEFPPFDKTWPFTVQEKWFDTYLELRRLEEDVEKPKQGA